jgi:hypothetical protein
MASVLGLYVNRWQPWVAAGLQGFTIVRQNLPLLRAVMQYIRLPPPVLRQVIIQRHKKIDRFAVSEKG